MRRFPPRGTSRRCIWRPPSQASSAANRDGHSPRSTPVFRAMSANPVMLARLARARLHAERRLRLGFDDRRKIKQLAELEAKARNGEIRTPPPKPVAIAPEISEGEIRRACRDLHRVIGSHSSAVVPASGNLNSSFD